MCSSTLWLFDEFLIHARHVRVTDASSREARFHVESARAQIRRVSPLLTRNFPVVVFFFFCYFFLHSSFISLFSDAQHVTE